jgi:hypothetical protein
LYGQRAATAYDISGCVASAIIIAVDLHTEELPCGTEVRDLVFPRELLIDLDHCFGDRLRMWIHHGYVINGLKNGNAIAADFDVRIGS